MVCVEMTVSGEEIKAHYDDFNSKSFDEIVRDFPKFLEWAKNMGYADVVKSPKFREILKVVQDSLKGREVDEVAFTVKELSLMSFYIFDDLLVHNEFALAEIATIPDTIISFQCPDLDFFHYIKIEDGKYTHVLGKVQEIEKKKPELEIILTKGAMVRSTLGESSYPKELIRGNIQMEGNIKRGIQLQQVFEIIKSGLDFELKLM